MATFDLTEYLEDDSVKLKIPSRRYKNGHEYTFESPDFETGLWLKNMIEFGQRAALGVDTSKDDLGKLVLDDDEEVDLYRRVMGDTFDQLRADKVSWGHTQEVFRVLLRKWGTGQDIAVILQEAQGNIPTQPNREARRASARTSSPKAGSKSNRTSSGTKAPTRGRGSTSSSGTSGGKAAARTA